MTTPPARKMRLKDYPGLSKHLSRALLRELNRGPNAFERKLEAEQAKREKDAAEARKAAQS